MRKKLFAILMSAMMMVTFMPAMAFAAADITATATANWASDYSKVEYTITYTKGTVVKTTTLEVAATRSFDTSTGMITASPVPVERATFDDLGLTNDNKDLLKDTVNAAGEAKYYYNFTNAEIVGDSDWITFSNITDRDKFLSLFNATTGECQVAIIKLVEPADVAKENRHTTPYVAHINASSLAGYDLVWDNLAATGYDADNLSAQKVTLTGEVVAGTGMDTADLGKLTFPDVVGEYVISDETTLAAVTVKADDITASYFYVDKVSTATKVNATYKYDGATHTVVMKPVEGISAKYQLKNEKTKKYEDVETPAFKNVGTYNFKAIVTDAKNKTNTVTFYVTVSNAVATVGFEYNDAKKAYEFDVPETFDAKDFVEFVGVDKFDKAAVAADAALIKEYFNDFYKITLTAGKYDPSRIEAEIAFDTNKVDALTTAEKEALVAKYATLYKNFKGNALTATTLSTPMLGMAQDDAVFNVTGGEIDWVKAPLTKTYKYKNLKKKAKTFTIKASAGSAVTYKLSNGGSSIKINKTTGKVTVKKGLKKGTYKVVVTAKAGKAADSYELKIKVK